jgi:hypothetical protein
MNAGAVAPAFFDPFPSPYPLSPIPYPLSPIPYPLFPIPIPFCQQYIIHNTIPISIVAATTPKIIAARIPAAPGSRIGLSGILGREFGSHGDR